LELRILGPLEARPQGGDPVRAGPSKQRAVLAPLATRPGHMVPIHTLIDGRGPPERALASRQVYMSRLRRAPEPDRAAGGRVTILMSRAPSYLVAVPPEAVDATRLASAMEHSPDDPDALSDALSPWRATRLGATPLGVRHPAPAANA
jgi:hypothetical protein